MREFDIGYPHSQAKRIIKEDSRSIKNKIIAWNLGEEYYDGQRENGYGIEVGEHQISHHQCQEYHIHCHGQCGSNGRC